MVPEEFFDGAFVADVYVVGLNGHQDGGFCGVGVFRGSVFAMSG